MNPTENETKHTPFTEGPWPEPEKTGDSKRLIIEKYGPGNDNWKRLYVEVDSDDCDSETALANATLIAAAPDLLAALEVSVATMSKVQVGIAVGIGKYSPDIVTALAQARAAIARAKGAK